MPFHWSFWACLLIAPALLAPNVAAAGPWLQETQFMAERWNLPFLVEPRRTAKRPPKISNAQREIEEMEDERRRERNRMPQQSQPATAAKTPPVFPDPAPPAAAAAAPAVPEAIAAIAKPDPQGPAGEREVRRALPPLPAPPREAEVPASLACAERLAKIARYVPLPDRTGPGQCGATDVVRLDAVILADRSSVTLNPAPQLRCGMADEVAQWIRNDLAPAAESSLGAPLASLSTN